MEYGPSLTPLGTLCVHRPCQGYTHNPTGLPVRSQGCSCNPTEISMPSQGCTQTPIKMPPSTFLPHSRLYVFILYILQETARLSVCARQVRDSILRIFLSPCGLPVSCCLATSVAWSRQPISLFARPRTRLVGKIGCPKRFESQSMVPRVGKARNHLPSNLFGESRRKFYPAD